MSPEFKAVLEALAFPPGNVLLLALAGALFLRGSRRRALIAISFVLLYLQSAPATVAMFVAPLEQTPPLSLDRLPSADAIVVLGSGRYRDALEYGRDTASAASLERLQYAADLERASSLPIVISGGSVEGEPDTEAAIMAGVLHATFGIEREILVETRSRNTAENALFTKELLDARGWHTVLLVAHARDIPRAAAMFEKYGVDVVPAPIRYQARQHAGSTALSDWLPQAGALRLFREAAHEYVGMAWYRLRY